MSEVQKKAQEALAEVEAITAVVLPEPSTALVPLHEAEKPVAEAIQKRMEELDMDDTNSIINFGSAAQAELQEISQSMLQDVRNKDVGPAGDSLRDIVTTIRGFSVSELDLRRKRSFWERITGQAAPLAKFAARFETVQSQIDKVSDNFLQHEHKLLKDIKSLDVLYERTLDFYDELALYITAGAEKLSLLDSVDIPEKEKEVADAAEDQGILKAQ